MVEMVTVTKIPQKCAVFDNNPALERAVLVAVSKG